MDERFDGIDKRLDNMDERFDGIDKRLDNIDERLQQVEINVSGFPGFRQDLSVFKNLAARNSIEIEQIKQHLNL